MTGPASKTANIKDENADPKSTEDIYSGTQEDAEMEERYWKQFVSSGSVEDYLTFVSNVKQEQTKKGDHAGLYMGDWNHTEAEPGGGVRQAYQPFD